MEKGKSEGGKGEVGLEAGGEGAREESIRRRQSPSSGRRALHNRIEHKM